MWLPRTCGGRNGVLRIGMQGFEQVVMWIVVVVVELSGDNEND